jgi:AraC-like DNA-binding protein
VEQALDVVYRYHALTSDAYQVHLRRHRDRVEVIARAKPIWQRHATVIAEEFITGLWVFLGELLPSSAAREHVSIQLAYSEPAYPFRYRDLMPCRLEFGSNATSVSFPLEWGALPVETADATVAAVCREQCDELLDVEGAVTGIVGDVKRVILSVPSNRPPRLSEVAEQMMMSPRTLERELQQAGHSFRRIDNEVRMGLAAQYVALGSISGRQISSMLGYSEPAAFYRAFKQWHGKTPREYREA